MGANVVNLAERRKTKPVMPSLLELATFISDEILDYWTKAAKLNRLNDYFVSCTPSFSQPEINYLEDLNAISGIEQRIGLHPQTMSPEFGIETIPGWVAAFRINAQTIASPFLASEALVRCFNILLFLRLHRDLKVHNITV